MSHTLKLDRKSQFVIQSHYNQWMNQKLYTVCKEVPDKTRKKDMGAFFHSVHGTLNHLLLGDRLWMGRFTGTAFPVESLDQELYSDFEALWEARTETDTAIDSWIYALTEGHLYQSIATLQGVDDLVTPRAFSPAFSRSTKSVMVNRSALYSTVM